MRREDELDQRQHIGTEDLLVDRDDQIEEPDPQFDTDRGAQVPHENEDSDPDLFSDNDSAGFRDRWHEVQAAFVDSPREAVQDADELVAELMRSLATTFSEHKQQLEGQWQRGDDVATEDLRLAFQRYRVFFNHLLKH